MQIHCYWSMFMIWGCHDHVTYSLLFFCVVFTGCTRILHVSSYYPPCASAKPKLRDFAHPPPPQRSGRLVVQYWTWHLCTLQMNYAILLDKYDSFQNTVGEKNTSGCTIWRSSSSAADDSGLVGSLACQTSCTTNNSWSKNYNANYVRSCKTAPHKNLGGGMQVNGNVVWEPHVMTSTGEKAKTLTQSKMLHNKAGNARLT